MGIIYSFTCIATCAGWDQQRTQRSMWIGILEMRRKTICLNGKHIEASCWKPHLVHFYVDLMCRCLKNEEGANEFYANHLTLQRKVLNICKPLNSETTRIEWISKDWEHFQTPYNPLLGGKGCKCPECWAWWRQCHTQTHSHTVPPIPPCIRGVERLEASWLHDPPFLCLAEEWNRGEGYRRTGGVGRQTGGVPWACPPQEHPCHHSSLTILPSLSPSFSLYVYCHYIYSRHW